MAASSNALLIAVCVAIVQGRTHSHCRMRLCSLTTTWAPIPMAFAFPALSAAPITMATGDGVAGE